MLSTPLLVGIAVVVLWLMLEAKTSRPDGTLVKTTHPYRKLMPYVMKGRNESLAYLPIEVRAEAIEAYLAEAGPKFGANMTHAVVATIGYVLHAHPEMNRFISGRRMYQHKGRSITFSMKRKKLDKRSKIAVVKLRMKDDESFKQFCDRINEKISHQRSGKKTTHDKEYALFNLLPRPVLRGAVWLIQLLDYYNLLPNAFIAPDGMYASVFVANLGSLNMPAAFHHLYEWGNCAVFVSTGVIEDKVVWEDGEFRNVRVMPVVVAMDERIEDGLSAQSGVRTFQALMKNPRHYLGCLNDDGSDHHAILAKTVE